MNQNSVPMDVAARALEEITVEAAVKWVSSGRGAMTRGYYTEVHGRGYGSALTMLVWGAWDDRAQSNRQSWLGALRSLHRTETEPFVVASAAAFSRVRLDPQLPADCRGHYSRENLERFTRGWDNRRTEVGAFEAAGCRVLDRLFESGIPFEMLS